MRAVHDTIENRVGQRRITQVLMPAITRELARDDRGPPAIPVVEDLRRTAFGQNGDGKTTPRVAPGGPQQVPAG